MSLRDRVRMAKDMHQSSYPYNAGEYSSTPELDRHIFH